ncbi:hypothetical protein Tco_0492589 [Tanacetum coccineum]
MLHGLREVNPVHAYYNGSCSSKDNEDPSWSTSFKTRRTQKTSSALEALWKTLFVLYLYMIGTLGLPTKVNKARAVMSSASSAVTYTSVYTDSEPGRVFWGADEELSDGGSPRVIVYGYDGLPMQPVAPPSPDYIPGPEEPQTPPVPQDEDEREPMFIQPHDPDYVPEPMYPEYIPLEDEHVFLAEEQPLPPVVSPTAESPGYVVESTIF